MEPGSLDPNTWGIRTLWSMVSEDWNRRDIKAEIPFSFATLGDIRIDTFETSGFT